MDIYLGSSAKLQGSAIQGLLLYLLKINTEETREKEVYLGTNNPLYFGRDFQWPQPHQMDFVLPTFHKGELPKPTNPRRKSSPRPEVSRVQCNSGFLNQDQIKCTVKCRFRLSKSSYRRRWKWFRRGGYFLYTCRNLSA